MRDFSNHICHHNCMWTCNRSSLLASSSVSLITRCDNMSITWTQHFLLTESLEQSSTKFMIAFHDWNRDGRIPLNHVVLLCENWMPIHLESFDVLCEIKIESKPKNILGDRNSPSTNIFRIENQYFPRLPFTFQVNTRFLSEPGFPINKSLRASASKFLMEIFTRTYISLGKNFH